MELIKVTRIFLNGFIFFFAFPLRITNDGKITAPSPILKLMNLITPFATNSLMLYLYGFVNALDQIRNNPYLMLGTLRGFFFILCGFAGVILAVSGTEKLAKIFQTLNDLQEKHKFSQKKLGIMLHTVLLQLFIVYLVLAMTFYLSYEEKEENVFQRLVASSAAIIGVIPMIIFELFYINCTMVLVLYFDIFNQELKNLEESYSNKYLNIWPEFDFFITETPVLFRFLEKKLPRLRKILEVQKFYEELYEVKELMQNYFSGPLLMTITASFAETIFTAFMYIVVFQYSISNALNMKEKMYLSYSPIYPIRVFLLVYVSEMLSQKMKETGYFLLRLIHKASDFQEREKVFIVTIFY